MDSLSALRSHIAAFVGTPLAKAEPVSIHAMLKSEGNPYHDKKTGKFTAAPVDGNYSVWLPPSDGISTLAEAKAYYKAHIAGIWTLVINRKAGLRRVKVNMRENEEHAYTKTVNGQRVFWPERAKRMSALIHTMARPGVVLENGNRDLYVESFGSGDHDVVVLEWKEDAKEYRFRSYHYWDRTEFNDKTASTDKGGYLRAKMRGVPVQKDETPIRKSVGVALGEHSSFESPPNFTNLHRTSLADSFEFGEALAGIGWPHVANMEYATDIVKAHKHDAVELFRAGCGDEVSLTKNPEPDFDSITKSYLTKDEVRAAAHAVYRFPHEPTPAQIKAGNYGKRKVAWNGLTISIENEAGSVRRGTKPDGTQWETRMIHPYGYLNRTEGVDGDHVDVFLGPDLDAPMVYVIHQRKAGDEHWIA